MRYMRTTVGGHEYWDSVNKKTVLLKEKLTTPQTVEVEPETKQLDLNDLTVKELQTYAQENKIELPKEVKFKNDIIKYINDAK